MPACSYRLFCLLYHCVISTPYFVTLILILILILIFFLPHLLPNPLTPLQSNGMFQTFLDETMTYSCAIFQVSILCFLGPTLITRPFFSPTLLSHPPSFLTLPLFSRALSPLSPPACMAQRPEEPLVDAQLRKLRRLIAKLRKLRCLIAKVTDLLQCAVMVGTGGSCSFMLLATAIHDPSQRRECAAVAPLPMSVQQPTQPFPSLIVPRHVRSIRISIAPDAHRLVPPPVGDGARGARRLLPPRAGDRVWVGQLGSQPTSPFLTPCVAHHAYPIHSQARVDSSHHALEIGFGWGSLALNPLRPSSPHALHIMHIPYIPRRALTPASPNSRFDGVGLG
ncbi:unnamed protein product [Closterium sp. NIES-54]